MHTDVVWYCTCIRWNIIDLGAYVWVDVVIYRYATYRSSAAVVVIWAYECTCTYTNTFIKPELACITRIYRLTNTITQIKRDLNLQQNVADSILRCFNTQHRHTFTIKADTRQARYTHIHILEVCIGIYMYNYMGRYTYFHHKRNYNFTGSIPLIVTVFYNSNIDYILTAYLLRNTSWCPELISSNSNIFTKCFS